MSPRKIPESSIRNQPERVRLRRPGRSGGKTSTLAVDGIPLVVGTIHSDVCIKQARALRSEAVDLLELRVDHFASQPERLLEFARNTAVPLIVTVRAHDEGGAAPLSTGARRDLFMRFLPHAKFIDLELAAMRSLHPIVEAARERKTKIIVSHHDFHATPSSTRLASILRRARQSGSDITKIATQTTALTDLIALLLLFSRSRPGPLSVMAMGPWGKAGRLLLARAGSILNYGYIGQPQVPGQWEATTLKSRLRELFNENDTPSRIASRRAD